MKRHLAALLVIVSISVLGGAQPERKRSRPPSPAAKRGQMTSSTGRSQSAYSINDILWWLPEDTETVSVVRGPIKVEAVKPSADMPPLEFVDRALRSMPLAALQTIKKGIFFKHLEGQGVLLSVEGSRRFRPPKSLGGMLFEGCSIAILEQDLAREGNALIAEMSAKAKQVQR